MNGKRIAAVIFGIMLMIGGFWCMRTPLATDMAFVWVFGVFMFAQACGEIATYSERKAAGYADGFSLAMSINSLILGLILIFSWRMEIVTAGILVYFVFFWLIFEGVLSIVGSVQVKRALGISPVLGVLLGIMMILAGFFGVAHPLLGAISLGIITGANIAISGMELIIKGIIKTPEVVSE